MHHVIGLHAERYRLTTDDMPATLDELKVAMRLCGADPGRFSDDELFDALRAVNLGESRADTLRSAVLFMRVEPLGPPRTDVW